MACVGAGIGGGFQDTSDLKVMKLQQVMVSKNRVKCLQAMEEELHWMWKHKVVWTQFKLQDIRRGIKSLNTMWAMKKKSNGTYQAKINARGFKQVDGQHYDNTSIASSVTIDTMITIMMKGDRKLCNIKGVFLHGEF